MRTQSITIGALMGSLALALVGFDDTASAQTAVQWRVVDGGNGHWYMGDSVARPRFAANASAIAQGGHLATVTNWTEHQYVMGMMNSTGLQGYPWLGGYQDVNAPDYSEPSGGWRWVTGEPWVYQSWGWNEPNNYSGNEHWLHGRDTWNDAPAVSDWLLPSLIEWSADCNADGIIDYGQCQDGSLPDANHNNVPDACEPSSVTVPGDYATIQAAINATPLGFHRLILVAPGTYGGPIYFAGRDVIVRGASAGKTIIAGTGGASSSVVRFTGGEPATAALERVTVRGGTTGTPFPWNPSILGGGGIMSFESAACLRDCIIEDNNAVFGGGAYYWQSTGDIDGCTFKNNEATTDGGGVMIYGGSVDVVDTTIELNYANSRGGGMHIVEGTPSLLRTDVRTNESNNYVGGISWVPQGVAASYLTLTDCDVTGNTAAKAQGGIGVVGDGPISMSLAGTTVCTNLPLPNVTGMWLSLGGNDVCVCAGDIVMDGVVNGVDLASLLNQWGTSGQASGNADLNHDGLVDGADLALVLTSWGVCP